MSFANREYALFSAISKGYNSRAISFASLISVFACQRCSMRLDLFPFGMFTKVDIEVLCNFVGCVVVAVGR